MSLDRLRLGPVAQLLGLLALGSRGTAWFAPYIVEIFGVSIGSTGATGTTEACFTSDGSSTNCAGGLLCCDGHCDCGIHRQSCGWLR